MKATDIEMARLALARGLVSQDDADRALAEADRHQALGLEKSVDDVLLEKEKLTPEQVRALREALGWALKRPRIGDYEVLRRVGLGGMGSVFEARHIRLKQRIALKVLFPRLANDPEIAGRFLEEARALARLSHPHLVHAIDAGRDGEYYYLAMELIEGENLLQVLARSGPMEPLAALEVVRAVTGALAALEEKSLIHRDVKPANILLGAKKTVKLADLGLFKRAGGAEGTREGLLCGTPHYISPEQVLRRDDLDVRSDLYSLGVTWYHMLAGRPPFVGRNTNEILMAHLEKEPMPPSRLRARVPPAMERMLLRWLAKDREERPASAKAALAELDRLASSVGGGRMGKVVRRALARARGLSRRTRFLLVLGAAALAATVVIASLIPKRAQDAAAPPPGPIAATPARQGAALEKKISPPAPLPLPAAPGASRGSPPERKEAPVPTRAAPPIELLPSVGKWVDTPLPDERPQPVRIPLSSALHSAASSGAAALETLRATFADHTLRFESLRKLSRTFHASLVAVEPGRDPPAGIILGYGFDGPAELDDFRSRPGAWEVRGGGLVGLSGPSGEALDSVAWFRPPIRIAWDLPVEAPLIVGLGMLRVAPGRGEDGRVWLEEETAEPVSVLAAPVCAAGPGAARITADGVEIETGAGKRVVRIEVPERGRLVLRIAPNRALAKLSIEGVLDPAWAAARLKLAGR